MKWTAQYAAKIAGGRVVQGSAGRIAHGISTDTRIMDAGDAYIALKGERFDGRDFVGDADKKGAAWVMVGKGGKGKLPPQITVVEVADTLDALGKLAAHYRNQFDLKVAAITGSVGKSTTKEMAAAVLMSRGPLIKNKGNYNNRIGLPLTLFRLRNTYNIAVLEMGCNQPGEIGQLMKIARPDVGLITKVAPAHLLGLGSLANVAKAKAEMIRGLHPKDTFVLNLDDPLIEKHARGFKGTVIGFSMKNDTRFKGESVHLFDLEKDVRGGKPMVRFRVGRKENGKDVGRKQQFYLQTLFGHDAINVLGACALGRAFGVSLKEAAFRLKGFKGLSLRGEVVRSRKGMFIINDTYNANPDSVRNALETLAWWKGPMRGVAVLGEMTELGKYADKYHRLIGSEAVKAGVELLVARGPHAKLVREGALAAGLERNSVLVAKTNKDAERVLKSRLKKGDWVLVKGSRAMAMETVANALL